MVLECEGCGCVHAERKRAATSRSKPKARAAWRRLFLIWPVIPSRSGRFLYTRPTQNSQDEHQNENWGRGLFGIRVACGSCVKCIVAKRKRLGVKKGQCTDCKGPLPHGEEIGMCRPCARATWGDR